MTLDDKNTAVPAFIGACAVFTFTLLWAPSPTFANTPVREPRSPQLDQRWAIRGCPVGDNCHGEPQKGLVARTARPKPARPNFKPSQIRPDLPWLDKLVMPDIPVRWNNKTIRYLEFYKDDERGRSIMSGWLRAQNRYAQEIKRTLAEANLPSSLLYIAMIESSYNPHEYSRVGASGLWQFMPAGGRIYGLQQTRWLDERNDPVRSTRAAAAYFKDLHHRFGDWDLALAAYNAGYGAVLKAIAKYNSNDYWSLSRFENALPWEATDYVPKFLAAAIIGKNRKFFGFETLNIEPKVEWDVAQVPGGVRLKLIAKACEVEDNVIRQLNPQLRFNRTPPNFKTYAVRIPKGSAALFASAFGNDRHAWDDVDEVRVRHGERFEDIATTYGISRSALKELNGLKSESELRARTVLLVPKVSDAQIAANREAAKQALYASGVPSGKPGDPLMVAVPNPNYRVKSTTELFYRVVSGDTLYGIAMTFGVDRIELAGWNGLNREAHLHPRMVLRIFAKPGFSAKKKQVKLLDPRRIYLVKTGSKEHLNEAERRVGRKRNQYTTQKTESLASIGRRYGLNKWDMARINQISPDTELLPGEQVLVYEVVDAKRSDRARKQARAAKAN